MDRLSDISKIPSTEALERVQGLRNRDQNQDKASSHGGTKPGEEEEPLDCVEEEEPLDGIEEEEGDLQMAPENETGIEDPEPTKEGETECQDGGAAKGRVVDIKV